MSGWQVRHALAYLKAKEVVDRRSLNRDVRAALLDEMATLHAATPEGDRSNTLRVLELGAGRGWLGLDTVLKLPQPWHLIVNEVDPVVLDAARRDLATGLGLTSGDAARATPLHQDTVSGRNTVEFLPGDFMAPGFAANAGRFDFVIAHSVADLFDVRDLLTLVATLLRSGGLFYAPVTVDGGTAFSPPYTPAGVETALIQAYEHAIDRNVGAHVDPSRGGSRAGHALAAAVGDQAGWELLADGASDWRVASTDDGGPEFLAHMVHFFEDSLTGRPGVSPLQLLPWLAARRTDLSAGRLAITVRNRDILARHVTGSAAPSPR